jgi:hypothetical protein
MPDDPDVLAPIPPLVTLLLHLEKRKGAPITEQEVVAARDDAVCMVMPVSVRDEVASKRGYDDISLENVWLEWQAIRPSLLDR